MTATMDTIQADIFIAAPVERVWTVLTQGGHVGNWFGIGEPATIELWAGGDLVIVHNHTEYGTILGRVEAVEPPRYFAYRWSQGLPGMPPDDGNTTLVEFTLSQENEGTRLHMIESGFSRLNLPERTRQERHEQNSIGWSTRALPRLQSYVTDLGRDE